MNEFERASIMNVTINILNDVIIDELIQILFDVVKIGKIGEIISKGSKALLREIDLTKNNLRFELKGLAIISEKK